MTRVGAALKSGVKRAIRRLVPHHYLASLAPPPPKLIHYSAPYPSWDAAKRDATGYASPDILAAMRKAALAVKTGEAAFERDGMLFHKPDYRWPMLACLLHARGGHATFHVVDFGGSLGTTYLQHRVFLDDVLWSVVEQQHIAACGAAEFADARLKFFDTIAQAAARAPVDAVLFSSVLEYLDDPNAALEDAARLAPSIIVVDRAHLSDAPQDEIKLQRQGLPLYPAVLAVRFLSRENLKTWLAALGYDAIAELPAGGYAFQRRKGLR